MSAPLDSELPSYCIDRRAVGYAHNDGRYVVQRVRGHYWSPTGVLTPVGRSKTLGITDTYAHAHTLAMEDAASLGLPDVPHVWGNGQPEAGESR